MKSHTLRRACSLNDQYAVPSRAGQRVSSCFPFGLPSPPPLPKPLFPLQGLLGVMTEGSGFTTQFLGPFGSALPGSALAEATAPRTITAATAAHLAKKNLGF